MIACFGGQTVGFVTVVESGEPGFGGMKSTVRELVKVSGCHFRPNPWRMATSETSGQTDVSTEVWKLTAPPVVASLAAKSTGEIVYDGTANPSLPDDLNDRTVFRIDGATLPKYDLNNEVHHVTVMCKRQDG